MGWIRNKDMKRIGSLNSNPRNNGAHKGPLRRITDVLQAGTTMFDRDVVKFECGHVGTATIGAIRGRCADCKAEVEVK